MWGNKQPRKWQELALPLALKSIQNNTRGVISAVMGSGKSILIAEICAQVPGNIVVTVPTIKLVNQMYGTIGSRLPDGETGMYFSFSKQTDARVTIVCMDSLASFVQKEGKIHPALWVSDECHRSESLEIIRVYKHLQPHAAIGFTATPFRAHEKESLSLWDTEVYSYGVFDALRDKVIVPFEVVHWKGGPIANPTLDEACTHMIKTAISSGKGPGIVNAVSISDAIAFSNTLQAQGVKSDTVHSRMKPDEVELNIQRLEQGNLDVLVHINMLSEGVDLPWLRWLVMRRPVSSRVRFCQEVGRVLRAYPGKDKAFLYDPHDLLGSFSLNYEAVLGGTGIEEREVKPLQKELEDLNKIDPLTFTQKPKELSLVRTYLRKAYLQAFLTGALTSKVKSTKWRTLDPSEKQIKYGSALARGLRETKGIPKQHRDVFSLIGDNLESFTRGDVSDFISLGTVLTKTNIETWSRIMEPVTEQET
jgi:late competence protein required for DNA uptake (superfamily II DNA/RNA helicase)